MAIGAMQADVVRMILRQTAALGALGGIVGLGLAAGAYRLTLGIVDNVSVSPTMIAGLVCVLIAVVSLAAWRASRIDPNVALKAQ